MPQKRTQPVTAPAPTRTTKPSNNSPSSLTVPSSKYSPDNDTATPALTPSSSTTPPSSFPASASLARSSKKLTKTVRSGHGHGHGHGNSGKGTMKVHRGPETELSDDDDEADEDDDDAVSVIDEHAIVGERVIEGVQGKSAPKSEVSMHTLLDSAKTRPQPQNISRGYELLTSPASRLVIPFDGITSGGKLRKVPVDGQGMPTPGSPSFSDDVEWEWEDLCFEMDGVDVGNARAKKVAYADVLKRAAIA